MINGWFLGLGESDEGGVDTRLHFSSPKPNRFSSDNDQARYIRDTSAELVNTLLDEAM